MSDMKTLDIVQRRELPENQQMSTDLNAAQQAAVDEAEAHSTDGSICQRCLVPWEFHAPIEPGPIACRADVPKMVEKIKRLDAARDFQRNRADRRVEAYERSQLALERFDADLARLRAGLAALEQEMETALSQMSVDTHDLSVATRSLESLRVWADRLAALREVR